MDYNYVRMRDALAAGDGERAEHYRALYESGTEKSTVFSAVNCAIAILALVAVLLGFYISHSEKKLAEQSGTGEVTSMMLYDMSVEERELWL